MVSKNQKKLIRSLKMKKFRKQHSLFVAEGIKVIHEFLDAGFRLAHFFVEQGFESHFKEVIAEAIIISSADLKQITFLTTSQKALAVFELPKKKEHLSSDIELVLDEVNDPGNLGTIIRLADWFGVKKIYCSLNTVDCYNPKVVQSTMGSLARIEVEYLDIVSYLTNNKKPVYGGFMDGNNVYQSTLKKEAIIVMGNEANGISSGVESLITERIAIPRFGDIQKTESLNVATATAILLSEFKRG